MRLIPAILKPYLSKAKSLKNSHCIREVEFSGPTYQVQVHDPDDDEDVWVFIQLDKSAAFQDAFCSCVQNEEEGSCWHIALAYLDLFDANGAALHQRFAESFWNALGHVWFERYGNSRPKQKKPESYALKGIEINCLTPEASEAIQALIRKKVAETEENSLKFSNLSEEELENWRLGNPSQELSYELSFWSDLAKHLMLASANEKWAIAFNKVKNMLPTECSLMGKSYQITTEILKNAWEQIIPALNTIDTPLKVFNRLEDRIGEITYNSGSGTFHQHVLAGKKSKSLSAKKRKTVKEADAEKIGSWFYLPGDGFYPALEDLEPEVIPTTEIGPYLDRHADEVKQLLTGLKVQTEMHELNYRLHFDSAWNLHLDPYLKKPGDLQDEDAKIWRNWAYLPKDGFYRLQANGQSELPHLVKEANVADFIRTQAAWLNQQAGFGIHLGSLETQILYRVDAMGALYFEKRLPYDRAKTKDFGPWIYLKDEGFFNKIHTSIHLSLPFGQSIRPDQVSHFIRTNLAELELVPGFLFDDEPIAEAGLQISLDNKERICVEPHFLLKPKYAHMKVHFYDEWIYLEGRGFSQISPEHRLPEQFREPYWVKPEAQKDFIENMLPLVQPWVHSIDPRLTPPITLQLHLTALSDAPKHSWKLKLHYETEKGAISLKDILAGFRKKKSFLFTPSGRIDLFQERLKWLKRMPAESIAEDGSLLLTTVDLLRLNAYEEIMTNGKAADLFRDIIALKHVPEFDCGALKSELRPYQEKGARWLFSIYHYALGALLCDEMGLGKTHQAMALMAAATKIDPQSQFLVVCPTSVLYHWEDKLKAFFPSLKVLTFHGPFRKKDLDCDFSLLLTSYGVWRNEAAWLGQHRFSVAFFDEIQVAKNHRSKLYTSLLNVKADVKIGLTGTPIENRLRELKSLFDIVLPRYMPNDQDYLQSIVRPIEKDRDMQQKSLLQRLVHPFTLRRKKIDVLSDLPEKTEEIAQCDMHPTQERLYRDVLTMQRDELFRELLNTSKPVPYLHVFALLTRLKQICDHPALYLKKVDEYKKYHSGKWELFLELLQEARESQQKVVVYSQYLGMLDIIESHLKEHNIGFASLRGTTRDRKEQIDLFAKDPSCEVFVASLKAAGLGIDLTAASVVIHYDRWWNAARENQATDRVHRFGQNRGVQVFKLLTKNSFEERIHQIIERKRDLMEETIAVDDHLLLKALSREEIYQLLMTS